MDEPRSKKPGVAAAAVEHFWLVVLIGGIGAVTLASLAYFWITSDAASPQRIDAAVKAAGAVAVVVAGLLTWATMELKRAEGALALDRDLTDRYGRAVELVGSDSPRVRLGGVYAVERFVLDAAAAGASAQGWDWAMGRDFLAAAAAEIQRSGPQPDGDESGEPIAAVVAAVQVLGRFNQRTGQRAGCAYDFAYLWLQRADLSRADLSEANLAHANLSGANLAHANLAHANLSGANLAGATLEKANLVEAHLSQSDLSGAHLDNARLCGANLFRARLEKANLFGADLSGARLSQADLSEAHLVRAELPGANLSGTDLSGADLSRAVLAKCRLSRADLSGANLVSADLSGADLSWADLSDASLSEADLTEADLSWTDLSRTDFGDELSGANLGRANLSGANLSRANLSGANLSGAGLAKTRYAEPPTWPEGFGPPDLP